MQQHTKDLLRTQKAIFLHTAMNTLTHNVVVVSIVYREQATSYTKVSSSALTGDQLPIASLPVPSYLP